MVVVVVEEFAVAEVVVLVTEVDVTGAVSPGGVIDATLLLLGLFLPLLLVALLLVLADCKGLLQALGFPPPPPPPLFVVDSGFMLCTESQNYGEDNLGFKNGK